MDVDKRKRVIFYVLSVAGESELVRRSGLVMLSAFCDKTRKSTFDLQMLTDKVALMKKEVFPYHFVGMHLVMLSSRPIMSSVVVSHDCSVFARYDPVFVWDENSPRVGIMEQMLKPDLTVVSVLAHDHASV
jgi:hypothetical protein